MIFKKERWILSSKPVPKKKWNSLDLVQQNIGYIFRDPQLLRRALTHKSFQYEKGVEVAGDNNETLEFLGDAVIDLVISDLLMKAFPQDNEGLLSKRRSNLVNEESLAEKAKELGVDRALLLGRGERVTGGSEKPRLLCSALEALFGAIYRDGGYEEVQKVASPLFAQLLQQSQDMDQFDRDYKTRYQEWIQKEQKSTPTYHLLKEEGPPHDRLFYVEVRIEDRPMAQGVGRSKKQAEQVAAQRALESEL